MSIGWERGKRARALAGGMLGLWLAGCGEYVSWNERWPFDGDDGHASGAAGGGEPVGGEPVGGGRCEAAPPSGYGYAEPPEFWLGTQAAFDLRVDGPGYLLADVAGDASVVRFLRTASLSVAPDGMIELGPGETALGYAPDADPEADCISALRAPLYASPQATSSVQFGMNLDSRDALVTFDVLDPDGSSNSSVSFSVFDSLGAQRWLNVHFSNSGSGRHECHVLVDGGDLVGGVPGTSVDVGHGWLQFDAAGSLTEVTMPQVAVSFTGAPLEQRITLTWGPVSSFAADSQVFALAVDGSTSGTAGGIDVAYDGDVRVLYDNGTALSIGKLGLARFAREAALAPFGEGWAQTSESGAPQLAVPQSAGRGMIVIESVSAWP